MKRIEPLDWLRGILAVSIMTYHLTYWVFYNPESDALLGRIGIYGVSMFFVLSGLSMALVYENYITNLRSSFQFFLRRFFRILPLLWVAVILLMVLNAVIGEKQPIAAKILLNLTTLFGFVRPYAYINVGAWSIGNEMVYYSLTPFLIMIFNRRVLYGNIIFALTVLLGIYFAIDIISTSGTLASQWRQYINPFNNFFLYCSGVTIYYNLSKGNESWKIALISIFVAMLIFIVYHAKGDLVGIVTGVNRFAFSIASILLVIGFYKIPAYLPKFASYPLEKIGVITYGIYLLHPIVYKLIGIIFNKLHYNNQYPYWRVAIVIVLTLILAQLVYLFIEKPFIKIGKRITSRISDKKLRDSNLVAAKSTNQ